MQPDSQPLARTDVIQAINRCIEAFNKVRAQLPKTASYHARQDNHDAASRAYLHELPLLLDLQSFQLYIACIAHGASIGAIDPIDVGRFCHLAQTAMSAWKLANLIAPAARKKEKQDHPLPTKGNQSDADDALQPADQPSDEPNTPFEAQENAHPLPAEGNQWVDEEEESRKAAAAKLPDLKTQLQYFKALRQIGVSLPSDQELRNDPSWALYFCEMARLNRKQLPPLDDNLGPEPAPEPQREPSQAA